MGKYEIRWCRIWEFLECVEAETEEEAVKTLHEERATKGSSIEIIDIKRLGLEQTEDEKDKVKATKTPRKKKVKK